MLKTRTGFHDAADKGDDEAMRMMLEDDPTTVDEIDFDSNWTALHFAARRGHNKIVAQLLASRASVDITNPDDETPLHFAVESGHHEVTIQLIAVASPTVINAKNSRGKTALHIAAKDGYERIVTLLLAARASIDAVLPDSNTSLHVAALAGHQEIVARLLDARAMVNAKNLIGSTALHLAAQRGRLSIVEQLLAASPTLIDAVDSRGWTALHCAINQGHSATVQHLLAACPALVNVVELSGWSTLHCAVWSGHVSIARTLLAINPELVFHHDKQGNSVLHLAILGHCDNVFFADLHKLNPQAAHCANESSETPFHLAVLRGNDALIDLLQWTLTFAEIEKIFTEYCHPLDRYLPVMEQQCELLDVVLNRDVKGVVFLYLGVCSPSPEHPELELGQDLGAHWFPRGVEIDSDGEEDDAKRRKTFGKPLFLF